MAEVRFGGDLGTVTLKGKTTEARGYGMVDGVESDEALPARVVEALRSLVQRPGYDIGPALEDASALAAELEARLGITVTMLRLSALEQ